MRIVVDLDETICELRKANQSYFDVKPKQGVNKVLEAFMARGDHVIIFTARHMKTCNNNVQLVRERMEELTIAWLKKNEVPYHELIFGKPYGDVYIDDLAVSFKDWYEVSKRFDLKVEILDESK